MADGAFDQMETGEPFDPPAVTWTQVSRRLIAVRMIVALWWIGVITASVVIGGIVWSFPWWNWVWVVSGVAVMWSTVVIIRQVRAFKYGERDDDVVVCHGVLTRRMVSVPYGRIQYVDVRSGPLERVFGLATVTMFTAAPSTAAALPGIPAQQAQRLRDRLTTQDFARQAGL